MRRRSTMLHGSLLLMLAAGCTTGKTPGAGAPAGQAPAITSFAADPPVIRPGQSSTLRWVVTGATSVSIDPPAGALAATSASVSPAATTRYTLTATGAAGRTTATVTVTVTADGTVPMTTAHRTTGVAPLAVFFDAVDDVDGVETDFLGTTRPTFAWTSGVVQPADREGTTYSWDFGDGGSGTWATDQRSKNLATGYTTAHVYERPGTYTVTLTVTPPGGASTTYTQAIEVSPFAGATRYVAAGGAGDGSSPASPWGSITAGIDWVVAGSGRQLLVRRGDRFEAGTSQWNIRTPGPNAIGAYGDGTPGHTDADPAPIIVTAYAGDAALWNTWQPYREGSDWRFVDLDLRASAPGALALPIGPPPDQGVTDLLVLRVKTSLFQGGAIWNEGGLSNGVFLVESSFGATTNCNMFVGARRLAVLGVTATDNTATHNLRVWLAHKATIAHNVLARCGGRGHTFKLHGPGTITWYHGKPETRWVTVTDNTFTGDAARCPWLVGVGSQSVDEIAEASPVTHTVWERNRFTTGWGLPARAIGEIEARSTMLRNNVFDLSGSNDAIAIRWFHFGADPLPPPDDIRIYNNTVYKAAPGNGNDATTAFLETDASATRLRVRNNFMGAPGGSANMTLITGTGGAGWVADHDTLSTSPGFSAAPGDLSPGDGSPASDAGVALPEVIEDFDRRARPAGAGYDLGAYEGH